MYGAEGSMWLVLSGGLKYSSSWEVTEILSTALVGDLCRSSRDVSEMPKFVDI